MTDRHQSICETIKTIFPPTFIFFSKTQRFSFHFSQKTKMSSKTMDMKMWKVVEEMRADPNLVKTNKYGLIRVVKRSIVAKELINWLLEKGYLKTRGSALPFCQELVDNEILKPVKSKKISISEFFFENCFAGA